MYTRSLATVSISSTGYSCSTDANLRKESYGFRGPLFPEKLFAAANESRGLIQWSDDGRSICVDADDFERLVFDVHPGLVEIASFANFRRQMREYGFNWLYHAETREFEFSHERFVRGRSDLLAGVLTRRKSGRRRDLVSRGRSRVEDIPRRRSYRAVHSDPVPVKRPCLRQSTDDDDLSDQDRAATTRPNDAAKSLNELTEEEWWSCCVPAIIVGITGNGEVERLRWPTYDFKLRNRVHFHDEDDDEASSPDTVEIGYGPWTHKALRFDEL